VAATSEPAIEWAAGRGYSILMDPHSPHTEIARKRAFFQERLEAAGHSAAGREIPVARLVALAGSESEAREVARRGARWIVGAYVGNIGNVFDPKGLGGAAAQDPVERYLDGVAIHGTPESVVDQLQRLEEEVPLDYLMCAPLSHESFVLFTERVLPKLL
jgi:alkanesulfonate monooxygenase SsuD/methylene tetrahydromethanopterin reductase-like flavin-dependent oxidoreductase (luciferase family)